MRIKFTPRRTKVTGKQLIRTLIVVSYLFLCGQTWAIQELPIKFPKVEGSKSFDLEISQLNSQAFTNYQQGLFSKAAENF